MPASARIVIENLTRSSNICSSGRMADTFLSRLVGLLGTRELSSDSCLFISSSSGVHTFGMSFPIDIVTLDKDKHVLGIWEQVGPWKVRGLSRQTHSVLELQSGKARQCGLAIGDRLSVRPADLRPA